MKRHVALVRDKYAADDAWSDDLRCVGIFDNYSDAVSAARAAAKFPKNWVVCHADEAEDVVEGRNDWPVAHPDDLVYVAYVGPSFCQGSQRVGVFSDKAAAFRAVDRAVMERLSSKDKTQWWSSVRCVTRERLRMSPCFGPFDGEGVERYSEDRPEAPTASYLLMKRAELGTTDPTVIGVWANRCCAIGALVRLVGWDGLCVQQTSVPPYTLHKMQHDPDLGMVFPFQAHGHIRDCIRQAQ